MAADPDPPHRRRVFAHWDLLNPLVRRWFPERGSAEVSTLAEEATLYVLNRLEADDFYASEVFDVPFSSLDQPGTRR